MGGGESPLDDLKNDIAAAVCRYSGTDIRPKVTSRCQTAGEIPYQAYWRKIDPNEVIPRGTEEWDEVQWRMYAPIIHIDLPNVDENRIANNIESIVRDVKKVIDDYIYIFDTGNDSYPAGMGVDPRLHIVILEQFKIYIGPKVAHVCLPPTFSENYKPNMCLSDQNLEPRMIELFLEDKLDRIDWETKWNEWRTIRDTRHSAPTGTFSRVVNRLKKFTHKK